MKLSVIRKKPSAQHLFYPNDEWTKAFLQVFNPSRPAKAFSANQMRMLKSLGFQITAIAEKDEIDI